MNMKRMIAVCCVVVLFLLPTYAQTGKATFWARQDVGVLQIYVDGYYIGSVTGYLPSGPPDCRQPQDAFPSATLSPGTHYYRAVGVEGYAQQFKSDGQSIVIRENGCLSVELIPTAQTYYDDSGYYEDDDDFLLVVVLGTALGFLLVWAAGAL